MQEGIDWSAFDSDRGGTKETPVFEVKSIPHRYRHAVGTCNPSPAASTTQRTNFDEEGIILSCASLVGRTISFNSTVRAMGEVLNTFP